MRPIWSGSISFGLVNIPVKLFSAVHEREINFDLLHKKDLSPIRYARVCETEDKEIDFHDLVRGYEYAKGNYVVVELEEIKKADVAKTQTISIVDFSPEKDIDSIYFEKPYFIAPDKGSEKAYALLRESLTKRSKVAIAKFVLRTREHLGAIKADNNVLVFEQMRFSEDLRNPAELNLPTASLVSEKELDMAYQLIDRLTEKFNPEKYKDTYTAELEQLLAEKVAGKAPKVTGKVPEPTPSKDLMEALKASLEKEVRPAAQA
ncbi:MAG: Ku protein [Patescibacteria group bacterium]|nr:Ku protein [Patescibacteria group bacterium]